MAGENNGKTTFKYYRYDPNVGANAAFAVLFGLISVGHIFFLFRKRAWYFIPFVIGCLFETIGYVGRIISSQETPNYTLPPFILQTLLILLAPALLAASIYMVLGRLIRMLHAEQYSVVRITWLTKIFVLGDVLSFLAQSAGGGLLANAKTKEEQDRGDQVVLAGLAIQVIFFGLFMVTTAIFHLRIKKQPTTQSFSITVPWKRLIYVLYFSSTLIMIRSIFRMIEFGAGNASVFMLHEGFLFGLDGALMLIACASFLWYHPGRILIGYKPVGSRADFESSHAGYPMMAPGEGRAKNDDSSYGMSDREQR